MNGSEVLQTVANVPAGGYASYTGAKPTRTDYYFTGWNPYPVHIQQDTVCYAQFVPDVLSPDEITDSWETIAANRGAPYAVGSWKLLSIGEVEIDGYTYDFGYVRMQKASDGESGGVSKWIAMDALKIKVDWNRATDTNWDTSIVRSWLNGRVLSVLPQAVRNAIVPTTIYTRFYDSDIGICQSRVE